MNIDFKKFSGGDTPGPRLTAGTQHVHLIFFSHAFAFSGVGISDYVELFLLLTE